MSGQGISAYEKRDECIAEAIRGGLWGGFYALVASGSTVGLANQFWPAFRSSLGISGKTALIALVLVVGLIPHLRDPTLSSQPLTATSGGHFLWSSVFYGYILYDTFLIIAFFEYIGSATFLLHHALALVCCFVGLYWRRMAIFGMYTQVILEATTPLLQIMSTCRLLKMEKYAFYLPLGLIFVVQFLICRVVLGNYILWWTLEVAHQTEHPQEKIWAYGGASLLAAFSLLNLHWFLKLIRMCVKQLSRQGEIKVSSDPEISKALETASKPQVVNVTASTGSGTNNFKDESKGSWRRRSSGLIKSAWLGATEDNENEHVANERPGQETLPISWNASRLRSTLSNLWIPPRISIQSPRSTNQDLASSQDLSKGEKRSSNSKKAQIRGEFEAKTKNSLQSLQTSLELYGKCAKDFARDLFSGQKSRPA